MTSKQIENREAEITKRAVAANGGEYCGHGKFITPDEQKELDELRYRRMIICCVCYGEEYHIYSDRTKEWGRTGLEYGVEKFGEQRAMEIFRDQQQFMKEHATIQKGVYTDHEGCTYNSIAWD